MILRNLWEIGTPFFFVSLLRYDLLFTINLGGFYQTLDLFLHCGYKKERSTFSPDYVGSITKFIFKPEYNIEISSPGYIKIVPINNYELDTREFTDFYLTKNDDSIVLDLKLL